MQGAGGTPTPRPCTRQVGSGELVVSPWLWESRGTWPWLPASQHFLFYSGVLILGKSFYCVLLTLSFICSLSAPYLNIKKIKVMWEGLELVEDTLRSEQAM